MQLAQGAEARCTFGLLETFLSGGCLTPLAIMGFMRIAILFAPVLRIKSRTRASLTDVKRTRIARREKRRWPANRGRGMRLICFLADGVDGHAQFRAASVWFGGGNQPAKLALR